MSKPKITIIIPTRERGDVIGKSLKTVLAQNYENFEVLVSDNCSSDQTSEVVKAIGDSRIRYINTGKRMSMSHNFEFALSHVDDGWVVIIGDDDGLVPGALENIAALIRDTGVKAIASTFCTYVWPNEENNGFGRLLVPMRRGYQIRSARKWLKRVIDGRVWYSELPMLYAGGAVHTSLINEIRNRRGSFFHSRYPDIFSTLALASVIDHYAFSFAPFAIAGHSRHSNGASWSASGRSTSDKERLRPSALFLSENSIPLHHDIPLVNDGGIPVSIDLLVYESYLQTMYIHGNSFGVTHQDQLAIFLARPISDTERMKEWVKLFVARHDLDSDKGRWRRLFLRARILWDRFNEYAVAFIGTYRVEPVSELKMHDVYEGSLVAAAVLKVRPNRLRSYIGTVKKWFPRVLRWRRDRTTEP